LKTKEFEQLISHNFLILIILILFIFSINLSYAVVPPVTTTQNASSVGRYDIYELTMTNNTSYSNPYDGIIITAVFTAPSAKTYTVGGFYYAANTWKLRFAPMEAGSWTWTLSYNDGNGIYNTSGAFTATTSNNTGFLRIHPNNQCRFMTEFDGKAFYPLGYNCPYDTTSVFFINTTAAGNNMQRAYGGSTNSFLGTFNTNNSGMNIYNLPFGIQGDQFAALLHKYGMKYQMSFFTSPPTLDITSNPNTRQAMLNYHKYMINRFGAYVDVWELFNEQGNNVPQAYIDTITTYIHKFDPYRHLITVSNDLSQLNQSAIDFVGTHQYISSDDINLDQDLSIKNYRTTYNKPVLLGEGGNSSPQGAYSPLRYRIQIWTAFFCEGGVLFWNGGAKSACQTSMNGGSGGIANQYIGSEERAESKVLSDFCSNFDPATIPITPTLTPANQMRCYALSSNVDQGIYIVHKTNHNTILSGATVKTNVPCDMLGQWIDPATGVLLNTFSVSAGQQTISIPPFQVDIVLRMLATPTQSVLQFNTSSYTVNSDQSSVTLSVNRLGGNLVNAISVSYNTADISAKAGTDYTAVSGTLNWAANDNNPKTITVPLTICSTLIPDITFNMVLTNPTGGATLGFSGIAMVTKYNTIINAGVYSANEFIVAKNAAVLNVPINRIGNGVGTMSVYYATRGSGGTDFVAIPDGQKTLNWADGDMTPKTIPITILGTAAAGRQFFVTMDDNGWSVPGSTYAYFVRNEITIIDPASSAGVLAFSGSTGMTMNGYGYAACAYRVQGNAGSITIPISRIGGGSGAVSITYNTSSQGLHVGTALVGVDFTDKSGTLNWADGDMADKIINIPIVNNTSSEISNTTFWVFLGNTSGGALSSSPTSAEVTIINSNILDFAGNLSSCKNSTQTYKTIFASGYSYLWNANGGDIIGADNLASVNIIWTTSGSNGTITLDRTNNGTGFIDSVSKTITINPLPSPVIQGPTNAIKGEVVHYSVQNNQVTNYKWWVEGGQIKGSSDSSDVDVIWGNGDSGKLHSIETSSDGCIDSASIDVKLVITSVNDIGKNNGLYLKLIPNPMSDRATIEITSNKTVNAVIQIVNSYGIVIKNMNNVLINEGTQNIVWDGYDMFGNPVTDGMYLIKLSSEFGVVVEKVILLR
jgi:hypothetical protein